MRWLAIIDERVNSESLVLLHEYRVASQIDVKAEPVKISDYERTRLYPDPI